MVGKGAIENAFAVDGEVFPRLCPPSYGAFWVKRPDRMGV